jgi:hypothetical protein
MPEAKATLSPEVERFHSNLEFTLECITTPETVTTILDKLAEKGYTLELWQKAAYAPRLPGVFDFNATYEPEQGAPESEEGIYANLGYQIARYTGITVREDQVAYLMGQMRDELQYEFFYKPKEA